jgi:hypothetical protein
MWFCTHNNGVCGLQTFSFMIRSIFIKVKCILLIVKWIIPLFKCNLCSCFCLTKESKKNVLSIHTIRWITYKWRFVDALSPMKALILSKEGHNIRILFLMEIIFFFWSMVSNPSLVVLKKSIASWCCSFKCVIIIFRLTRKCTICLLPL